MPWCGSYTASRSGFPLYGNPYRREQNKIPWQASSSELWETHGEHCTVAHEARPPQPGWGQRLSNGASSPRTSGSYPRPPWLPVAKLRRHTADLEEQLRQPCDHQRQRCNPSTLHPSPTSTHGKYGELCSGFLGSVEQLHTSSARRNRTSTGVRSGHLPRQAIPAGALRRRCSSTPSARINSIELEKTSLSQGEPCNTKSIEV